MSGKQESIRDLIERGAAEHQIAPRMLWGWALDAIKRDMLLPILPEGVSLDTKFDHGGMPLTWRQVIGTALAVIERHIPSNNGWANTLMFDPGAFDRWLTHDSPARTPSASVSPLPLRRRPTPFQVRQVVQAYVKSERKINRGTSIPRMWTSIKKDLPNATRTQAIDELRKIEGGPKNRGRPRDQ